MKVHEDLCVILRFFRSTRLLCSHNRGAVVCTSFNARPATNFQIIFEFNLRQLQLRG